MAMNSSSEAELLATLGSTTAEASTYESSVLRNAQLSAAPQIVLPQETFYGNSSSTSSSLVPLSQSPTFPELSSLAPSTERKGGNASADIPHVLKVLSTARDALSSVQDKPTSEFGGADAEQRQANKRRQIDILCMKEQILLSYLTDVAGLKETDELIPHRRRKRLREESASDSYYGRAADKRDSKKSKKKPEKSSSEGDNAVISLTNRLDRIKNGEVLDTLSTDASKPRKRTMMQMKSEMRVKSGLTPLKSMDEERFDAERSRRRRDERRKRRLRKQRAALGLCDDDAEVGAVEKEPVKAVSILKRKGSSIADGTSTNNDTDDSKRNGVCWGQDVKADDLKIKSIAVIENGSPRKNGVGWSEDVKKGSKSHVSQGEKRTYTKVMCPVCQVILTCEENDGAPEEFLSNHIKACQQTKSHGGRTLRRRTKPSIVDVDNLQNDEYYNESEPQIRIPVDEKLFDDEVSDDEPTSEVPQYDPNKTIDDIDEFDYEDRVDDWIENGIARMRDMSERDLEEVPPGAVMYEGGLEIPAWINNRLFPYQRTGVRWMWELHCQGSGGVVGDEMGLGKTVQVSSFVGAMAANRFLDSVLIIAPATMLSHWLSELRVWAPGLRRVMVHRSGESDGVSRVVSRSMLQSLQKWLKRARADRVNEAIDEKDLDEQGADAFCGTGYAVVTTYESIRRSPDVWINHDWSYVVLDEGQKIRNPDADVTLACKRLRTPNRLLMSGTPIQNDLRELWSLFDFIFPGRLGTLPAFEAEFAEPIKRGGYSNASPMQVQLAYRCALVLRDLINPFLLRRQKKDIKEVNRMPGKTEQVLFCRLSSKQRSLYKEYLASDEVMGVMKGSVQLLKAVTVLRKICNHPDLIMGPDGKIDSAFQEESSSDEDDFDAFDEDQLAARSGKLHVLSKILPLWKEQGHKVIIFTQWRKTLTIIERFTRQQGWKFARLDGNTNIASRQKLIDKFNQDQSYFIMLMTTRTGGVGLNVTGANRVLIFDPDWNPQTDAQARERAWRFGQKKSVTVYRLITAGTVEEKIYQRQIFKTAITNQVLQDPKQRRLFSQKDLKDLFTLKDYSTDTTETGKITRGRGDVDMNESEASSGEGKEKAENGETLEVVMKSKGLCGVFDHDFVENSSSKKKPSELEMEENAKKVAMKAALTLKTSTENTDRFSPTWTGSQETFSVRKNGAAGSKMASSSSMLAQLRNRRMEISTSAQPTPSSSADDKKYSALLLSLRNYIKRKSSSGNAGPTTKDLLNEFKNIPESDAAIFRSMLKSIATVKNGQWALK